jgi:hypothetical protein
MRVCLVLSVLVALVCRVGAQANRERESELKPGPFPQVAGSELGKPINFENMIDTHACFPLIVKWEVVGWIHRAHVVPTRVLVQRCVEFDPSDEQTPGNRHGGVREAWDRVIAGPGGHGLQFVPVTPRAWELFANPSFCGPLVAYWGTPQKRLVPSIYDFSTGQLVAVRSLGSVELETDDESYLPSPAWDAACAKASFDGRRAGKGRVELRIKRPSARSQ